MPCSAVTLSLATILAIVATALLMIAFATDNWQYYDVKRSNIQAFASKHSESETLLQNINSKYYYYTRTRGLFRTCFPKERPPTSIVPTYLSPIETHCLNLEYFPLNDDNSTDDSVTRVHLLRSCIAIFILSFGIVFCAFWTGFTGCWKRSSCAITATSILLLAVSLLAAGSMGLWHTVEFFENEKIVGEDYYQQWNTILKDNTKVTYDWSYIAAWAGIAACLVSAILLSGAAICLKTERDKEENLNLQYLMPVYSQKPTSFPQFSNYPQPQMFPTAYQGAPYSYNY